MRGRAGLAAFLLLASSACGPDLGESLRGRWEMDADRVEFLPRGRVLLTRHGEAALGEYAVPEADRLVLAFGAPLPSAGAGDYRVRVEGDSARLCETYRPHRCMTLVRARSDWMESVGFWRDTVPPRLASPPRVGVAREPRAVRAEQTLRQLHQVQLLFRAEEGRYTADPAELERVGWRPDAQVPGYHPPEIVVAGERLCAVMRPREAGLPAIHLGHDGLLGYGARCPQAGGTEVDEGRRDGIGAGASATGGPLVGEMPPRSMPPAPAPALPVTVPREAWMAEAGPVLKQIYTLQQTYQAQHGVFARTFAELETVGWSATPLRHHHPPRIVYADGGRLCVEMVPRDAGLSPQRVDQRGTVSRGRCR